MKRLLRLGRLQVLLVWYDLWVGAYYDVGHRTLYLCPLPMLVLRLELPGPRDEHRHRPDRDGGLETQLAHARAEQHRGEGVRHQLRKELGEALGGVTRARAEVDAWVRIARALEPLVLAVNEVARDGAAQPAGAHRVHRAPHEATLFAQGEGTEYWPMLAGAAPPEMISIAPPQWGLRPCRQCEKECAGAFCSVECWEEAKRVVEEGDPILPGPKGEQR